MSETNLVPIGDYLAKGVSGRYIEAKTGSDGAEVMCQIIGGPHDGRVVPWTSFFGAAQSPEQAERIFRQLKIAGAHNVLDDPSDLSGIGSTQFRISVIHEDYQNEAGETRTVAKVNWINAGSSFKAADPAKVAGMRGRFAGVLAGLKAKDPAPTNSPDKRDDSIPF